MRVRAAVLVAVTSVLTVVSPVHAGPRPVTNHPVTNHPVTNHPVTNHSATRDWAFVAHELFEVPLSRFAADAAKGDPWFDWSNDGCSAPLLGNAGRTYNFLQACMRHDFGYRNLQRLERRYGRGHMFWNAVNRRRVDQQFLADMKHHCRGRSWWLQPGCFLSAYTYYAAVRAVAGP